VVVVDPIGLISAWRSSEGREPIRQGLSFLGSEPVRLAPGPAFGVHLT
jgi:hypothetical protein